MSLTQGTFRLLMTGKPFDELSLRRKVFLSQLPLAIATLVTVLTAAVFTSGLPLADPWFVGGALGVAGLTVAAAAVPWDRTPTGSYWILPLLDLAAIFFLAAGAYPWVTGLPMLTVIPVFWMAWSAMHPRATVVLGFVATLVTAWGQYWHEGLPLNVETLGRPVVQAVIVLAVAVTANVAVNSMMASDRQLSEALRRASAKETLLNAVLNAASVGVVAVDRDGHDFLMNEHQRVHHLQGAPEGNPDPNEAQLLLYRAGKQGEPLDEPIAERGRPVYRAVRGEEFTDELIWIGPPGLQTGLAVSARRLTDADGGFDGSVVVFKDVTELIEANQAKDRFLASVSHELKTPLTSILGYLELAADTPGLPPPAVKAVDIANRNADRLLRLVNDLLTAAARGMELDLRRVDLMDVVRGSIDSLRGRAGEAGLDLVLAGPENVSLRADPERLGQVLDNLLSNAVKYTPRGGTVTVSVEAPNGTGRTTISVADTGAGLTPEEASRLFERFYRTDSVRASNIPGTGLGLSITRELVEAHGGSISVEGRPGVGALFRVELPTG